MKVFSLIEVLIVITVVGVLGTVAIPQLWISEQRVRGETFINNVNSIITTLEIYKKQNKVYPLTLEELADYFSSPPINPYTKNSMIINDETKTGIRYTVSSDKLTYTIEIVQKDIMDLNRNGDVEETIAEALRKPIKWSNIAQNPPPINTTFPIIIITNIPSAGSPLASPNPASAGTTIVLQANTNACYTLASWTSQDVQIQGNTFIMPSATVTIIANYTPAIYTVTTTITKIGNSPNTPGTVTGAGTYDCESIATVTAIPNTGFTFTGWYENGSQVSTNTTYSFTVSSNRTLEARFSAVNYNIVLTVTPSIAGSPSVLPNPANVGQTVILTANPNGCYTFDNWLSSDITLVNTTASVTTFIMPAKNVTITANYSIRTYTITTTITKTGNSPNTPGTVTGAGTYSCGSTAFVTAIPNAGFTFVGWYESGTQVSTNTTYNFTVSTSRTLEARFATTNYNISFVVNPTGAGSPSASPNPANVGQTVTLTANPDSCYTFSNWTSSDVTIANNTFIMPMKNVSVIANYNIKTYTVDISVNPTPGGTATGEGIYNCGSTATVVAIPATGYNFIGWYEDRNTLVSTDITYSFTVLSNRSLRARFRK